jgi:hypothetical protein
LLYVHHCIIRDPYAVLCIYIYVTYIITYKIYIHLLTSAMKPTGGLWNLSSRTNFGELGSQVTIHQTMKSRFIPPGRVTRCVKSGSPSGQSRELVTFLCDKGGMSSCVGLFGKQDVDSQQSPTKSVVFVQTYSQFHTLTRIIMHSSCCAVESLMLDGFDF